MFEYSVPEIVIEIDFYQIKKWTLKQTMNQIKNTKIQIADLY